MAEVFEVEDSDFGDRSGHHGEGKPAAEAHPWPNRRWTSVVKSVIAKKW